MVSVYFLGTEAFIMIVLMCSWLSFVDLESSQYEMIEFFAGQSRISRLAHAAGYQAARYDLTYDPVFQENSGSSSGKRKRASGGAMDFSSSAGFVFLVINNGHYAILMIDLLMISVISCLWGTEVGNHHGLEGVIQQPCCVLGHML